jgi:predicted MFS family arabinose efflux permease
VPVRIAVAATSMAGAAMDVPGTDRGLGRDFGRLWAAATVSALGDGLTQIAGPLLAVSITRDPVLIAGLTVAQQLPWMLFALPSGAMVDRVDRRRAMTCAALARAVALGALACLVFIGHVGMPLLYLVFFAVGCAGLIFENATTAVLPALVGRSGLERANGRLQSAMALTRSLVGPPSGAWLFALAAPVPFLLDAGGLALAAVLAATLPAGASTGGAEGPRATLRASIHEGVRWLLGNRLLRTLALTAGISNIGLGAVFSVFVLAARARFGTGPPGYGLLLAASAAGGLAGGLLAARAVGSIGAGWVLRAEMAVETFTYLGLALTRSAIAAGALLALLGMHLVMFSTVSASLRQSLAPAGMLGRVHGAYRLVSNGGMLAGAALGGVASTCLGLTAPFWLGFTTMSGVTALAWGVLSNREIRAARGRA